MVVRRPARVKLPESAYKAPEPQLVPNHLADLAQVPGRCYGAGVVVMSCTAESGALCHTCTLAELGETMHHLSIRTSQAIPKARYYRQVDEAFAKPDYEFRRQFEKSRKPWAPS